MKKFKTNIKCAACVATVTPFLNEAIGEGNWRVDLADPQRVLTTATDVSEQGLQTALKKAGYTAASLEE